MKRLLLFWLALSLLSCTGCAQRQATASQVLDALVRAEIGLPAGQSYLSAAPEDDPAYLPPALMSTLYGQGEPPWQLALIEDYGIWLSTAGHPCEFAVFFCYARSDTDEVAAMCRARLDDLCAFYQNTQYAAYLQNAKVAISGKCVLLLISSDPEHALRTATGAI